MNPTTPYIATPIDTGAVEASIREHLGLLPSLPPREHPVCACHPERQTGRTTDMIVKGLATLEARGGPIVFVVRNQHEADRVARIAKGYAVTLGLRPEMIEVLRDTPARPPRIAGWVEGVFVDPDCREGRGATAPQVPRRP